MRGRGQGDFCPLRGLIGLVLVQIDLVQNRDGFTLFQMGDDFALEAGLAAGVDVGRDFRRAGNERDRRLVDGLGRRGLVLLS